MPSWQTSKSVDRTTPSSRVKSKRSLDEVNSTNSVVSVTMAIAPGAIDVRAASEGANRSVRGGTDP